MKSNSAWISRLVSISANDVSGESGFSLLELLVSICLFATVGLAITQSTIHAMRFQKQAEIGNLATNLAVSRMEVLAGTNPDDLPTSPLVGTEPMVLAAGHDIIFQRDTEVVQNADGSLTITVTVSSDSEYLPGPVEYSTRFAPWES